MRTGSLEGLSMTEEEEVTKSVSLELSREDSEEEWMKRGWSADLFDQSGVSS